MNRARTNTRPRSNLGFEMDKGRSTDSNTDKPNSGQSGREPLAEEDEEEDDYMSMVIEDPSAKKHETSLQRQKRLRKEAELRANPKSAAQLAAESHAQMISALQKTGTPLPADNRGFQMLSKLGYTPGTALGKRPGDSAHEGGVYDSATTAAATSSVTAGDGVTGTRMESIARPILPNISAIETLDELDPETARKRRRLGIGYDEEQKKRIRAAAREGRRARNRVRRGEAGEDENDGGDPQSSGKFHEQYGNRPSEGHQVSSSSVPFDSDRSETDSDDEGDHTGDSDEDGGDGSEDDALPLSDIATKLARQGARRTRKSVRERFRNRLTSEREEKRAEGMLIAAQRIAEQLTEEASADKDGKGSSDGTGVEPAGSATGHSSPVPSPSFSLALPPLKSINLLWRGLVRDRRMAEAAQEDEKARVRNIMTLRPEGGQQALQGTRDTREGAEGGAHTRPWGLRAVDCPAKSASGGSEKEGEKVLFLNGAAEVQNRSHLEGEEVERSTAKAGTSRSVSVADESGSGQSQEQPVMPEEVPPPLPLSSPATMPVETATPAGTATGLDEPSATLSTTGSSTTPRAPTTDPDPDLNPDLDPPSDDPELANFESLPATERLALVLAHLRTRFNYCFWCKFRYASAAEMEGEGGCPGEDEDVHG